MWNLIWDSIGYFVDNISRPIKLLIAALFLAAVFFFFGLRPTLYVAGGMLWFAFLFLVVAHIFIQIRDRRKARETAPPPLTPADQADIAEFQEALEQTATLPTAPIVTPVQTVPFEAPQEQSQTITTEVDPNDPLATITPATPPPPNHSSTNSATGAPPNNLPSV